MVKLKKISKIKHLGVWADYSWGNNIQNDTILPDFKQFNVVYGWNGTGKTTLSRLLTTLNTGGHPEFARLEYTVQDSANNNYHQGVTFGTPVRVFNTDWIEENVDFDEQKSKNITVILGEENKEAVTQIKADEKELKEIQNTLQTLNKDKCNYEKIRGSKFTEIAKTISQGTQNAIVRNYNKRNAEEAFNNLDDKNLLGDKELDRLSKSVAQQAMDKLTELSITTPQRDLESIIIDARNLLTKTVESTIIERFKENSDIANWVEAGLTLHNKYKNNKCDFCGQLITADRIAELTAYFNKADAELKADIDKLAERLRNTYAKIEKVIPADKMNLYQEMRDEYEEAAEKLIEQRNIVLTAIADFGKKITDKKLHTTEKIDVSDEPNLSSFVESIKTINRVITKHNRKTDEFDEQRKRDSKQIETHYLSTIFDDVAELNNKIETAAKEIKELTEGAEGDEKSIGVNKLEKRIRENKVKISATHQACEQLNIKLRTFLGRDEITFKPNSDDDGYDILRGGNPAKNLSEGERTAIAFTFFVMQLGDDFDVRTSIVAIDDPVSSLDANSQFQAFSFLKNATEDAGQLFLFTHNFEFLKLILNWLHYKKRKHTSLYMVKNTFTGGLREAYLAPLDPVLRKYESEYLYLFDTVYHYKSDGTIENAYKMPNIARKLLESFLMFRIPKTCNMYERLQELEFDENKKVAIYKFVNDQSHITGAGFDPSLVPETQKCVGYLLELMETTFKDHYDYLVEEIS